MDLNSHSLICFEACEAGVSDAKTNSNIRKKLPTTFLFLYLCPMLTQFLQYLTAERRYSPLTIRNYQRDIGLFLGWLPLDEQPFDPTRIKTDDLREWILHRSETTRLSAASINREVSSLRSFFRWLHHTGRIPRNIALTVSSLKTPKRLPTFVPESRMAGIVETCEEETENFITERNSLIILLFYTCGLRLAELIGIDHEDFSGDYRSLKIRGKGDKERIVPVMEFVREKILRYISVIERQNICISNKNALFLSEKGERISRSAVYRVVKSGLQQGGMQGKKSPHVLRHTFATHLLNGGADMREIQELLGHASLQATQVYTHNSITALKAVYAKAHPRAKRGK